MHIEYTSGPDLTPPLRSNGQPSGTLAAGTTQTALNLDTDENATCKYDTISSTAFASMSGSFTITGGTAHSTTVAGLFDGGNFDYYVRCEDGSANANPDDFGISFSVSIPDVTPPQISAIAASPGDVTADITWTSHEPATSQVEYGTTPALGTLTTLDSSLTTSHSVTLLDLVASTTYYFQVMSADVNNNQAVEPPVPDTFTTSDLASLLPSQLPPGGLAPADVPMFVTFGSDDNYITSGNYWLVDNFYGTKTNPPGSGNPATYDGMPVGGSFYFIGFTLQDYGQAFRDSAKHA